MNGGFGADDGSRSAMNASLYFNNSLCQVPKVSDPVA